MQKLQINPLILITLFCFSSYTSAASCSNSSLCFSIKGCFSSTDSVPQALPELSSIIPSQKLLLSSCCTKVAVAFPDMFVSEEAPCGTGKPAILEQFIFYTIDNSSIDIATVRATALNAQTLAPKNFPESVPHLSDNSRKCFVAPWTNHLFESGAIVMIRCGAPYKSCNFRYNITWKCPSGMIISNEGGILALSPLDIKALVTGGLAATLGSVLIGLVKGIAKTKLGIMKIIAGAMDFKLTDEEIKREREESDSSSSSSSSDDEAENQQAAAAAAVAANGGVDVVVATPYEIFYGEPDLRDTQ